MVFKYCVFVLDIGGAGDVLFGLMLKLEFTKYIVNLILYAVFCLIGTQVS